MLNKENCDFFQFEFKGKNEEKQSKYRRQKKRLFSSVSMPVDHSSKKAKLCLEEKVRKGEIDIGENVVEKVVTKRGFDKSTGNIITKTLKIHARKHPLQKLRVKLFNKYRKYMRLNPDSYFENLSIEELSNKFKFIGEPFDPLVDVNDLRNRLKMYERTRNFQLWHDASCISNHGHILFCVNILYDQAVFYTPSEYAEKFHVQQDIQKIIETPELYIIGRCGNNDEQLGYIETRYSCLKDLKNELNLHEIDSNINIVLQDNMRFFMGTVLLLLLRQVTKKGGIIFVQHVTFICVLQMI